MPFPTTSFATFFVVVLVATWAAASRPVLRQCLLVVAGAAFYAYLDVRYVALLAGVALANWLVARLLAAAGGRARALLLGTGVTLDVAALGLFKYYGFFADAVVQALGRFGVNLQPPSLQILLPVGVSFYTFEAISYLVDVHHRRLVPQSLLDVATWLFFFPKLASGPITRAVEFMPQLAQRPDGSRLEVSRAFWLIERGLVKKLVLASFFASALTDQVFASPAGFSSLSILLGIYAYAAQIYTDFSGYTDMAIGIALLLGFRLPENFDRPYSARSVQDFWSRWHMTLSRWIRDYLFAPFLGHRRSGARTYLGLVGVMLLVGLWHGAGWTFVAFGAVHGLAMAAERAGRQHRRASGRRAAPPAPWRLALRRVATFHLVCLGWVFFASSSLSLSWLVLRSLVTNWSLPVRSVTPLLVLAVAAVLVAQYLPASWSRRASDWLLRLPRTLETVGYGLSFVVVLALAPTTVPAFIYFRF